MFRGVVVVPERCGPVIRSPERHAAGSPFQMRDSHAVWVSTRLGREYHVTNEWE